MKTKIEISGYEIEIEEVDGRITVRAEKDEEVVEEFTLEPTEGGEEGEEGGEDEMMPFGGEEGEEEEDFGGEEGEGAEEFGEEAEEEAEEEEEESNESLKLESFQSFINKSKK